jgi:pilus assembly protein CpaC
MFWKKLKKYILRIFSAPLFFILVFPIVLTGLPDHVEVGLGKSTLLNVDSPLDRVSIPQPEIADVIVISPWQILINGKSLGETSLILWGKDREVSILDLKVHSNRDYKQVMLEVRFAEVDRTALKELGFDLLAFGSDVYLGNLSAKAESFSFGGEIEPGGIQTGTGLKMELNDNADLFIAHPKNNIATVIKALEEKGLIRILAEPNLVTLSGREATFLSGGEFPIPVVQAGAGVGGTPTVTIEFKEFGIKLTFLPTVLDSGIINLEIAPEISSLDFTSGVTISGTTVPALRTRRARVTVELGNGESIAISGLISKELVETISRTPLLGQMPILGALFRSTRYVESETEMLMIISPHIIQASGAGEEIELPDVYQWER